MKLWFDWVGCKKDLNGKAHLWGVLRCVDEIYSKRFIVWGAASSRAYQRELTHFNDAFGKKSQKINEGYRPITQTDIERKWPDFMDDLEMQFMLDKLTQ
jgi:hypothetical protein